MSENSPSRNTSQEAESKKQSQTGPAEFEYEDSESGSPESAETAEQSSYSESLNVLVLATTFPRWEDDSIPHFVKDLSEEFQQHKMDVTVLAPHDQGAKRQESMDGLTVHRYPYFFPSRFQKLVFEGGVLPTVKKSPLALFQIPFFMISLLMSTAWLLRKKDIDVIHSHWVVPNGLVASLLAPVFGVRHVMTLHAGGVLGLQNVPANSRLADFIYRRSDAILPVSTHIRDSFTDILTIDTLSDEKFRIHPMGAHTSDFDTDSKLEVRKERDVGDNVVGLYVGRLAEKKGLKYLLDALDDTSDRHEDFQLSIVGRGTMKEELHSYAEQKGLEDAVEFTGWVSEEELHDRYIMADFVIVPSIETESGDTEGMPTVISEAFASANPVIGTNVGGIPDVIENKVNGYVVEQRQPNQLSEKMETLIEDAQLREELSEGAIKTAERLDWGRCGEVYTETIRDAYNGTIEEE